MQRFIVSETYDRRNGFEERLVDIYIGLSVNGVVGKVEKLDDPRFLVGFIKESVASELFLDQLTGG